MKHVGDYLPVIVPGPRRDRHHSGDVPAAGVAAARWGARLLANPSSHTTATMVVLGAIVGRASLGLAPDLEAGILALATVLVVMVVLGRLRRHPRDSAEVIVLEGVLQDRNLRRLGLTEGDVWSRLRQAGRGSLDGLALALLEPSGVVTLLVDGTPLKRDALADVRGSERLPDRLFTNG